MNDMSRLHWEILHRVRMHDPFGVTCDELEQMLKLSHQTASARVSELKKAGYLTPKGTRRTTRQGGRAAVLVATALPL